jgi:hypothetical protein
MRTQAPLHDPAARPIRQCLQLRRMGLTRFGSSLLFYLGDLVYHAQRRELVYRPNTAAEACTSAQLDYDGDGLAGCADDECWATCSPLCPPGSTCAASAPRCHVSGVRDVSDLSAEWVVAVHCHGTWHCSNGRMDCGETAVGDGADC